jgi:hypothetical protein
MAARLGEVLFWGSVAVVIVIIDLLAYARLNGTPHKAEVFFGGVAIVNLLLGIACRLLLVGNNRRG